MRTGCLRCMRSLSAAMRQTDILQFAAQSAHVENTRKKLHVYDLFCGAGGFSEGARQAGCVVDFACDNDPCALEIHRKNHPECKHMCCTLPCEDIPFPVDGRLFHVHGSPPCQAVSSSGLKDSVQIRNSTSMIEWFVNTALSCGALTWSMEQVASKDVIACLQRMKEVNRGMIEFHVFNFYELGVPQIRKRVLAGSPEIIRKLMRQRGSTPRVCIRDVVPDPPGTHIRTTLSHTSVRRRLAHEPRTMRNATNVYTKASWKLSWYPLNGPAPTVIAGRNSGWWIRSTQQGGSVRSTLKSADVAALQTFPQTYKFPQTQGPAFRLIGNAVPPQVAKLLMQCACDL